MTTAVGPGGQSSEVSLLEIASLLLRRRWLIVQLMLLGGILAVLPALFRDPLYTASASFVSHGAPDQGRAGLASLAGQLGIAVNTGGNQAESPQFYAYLLQSRAILEPIAADSFRVPALGREPRALLDLLDVGGARPAVRLENGINALADLVTTSVGRETGILTVRVTTPWPVLSYQLTERLIAALNDFNLEKRQHQAGEERRFTEERLIAARQELRNAEDNLQRFYQRNRAFDNSPELLFERDRLQRALASHQQIVTAFTEAFEEARVRQVRDTPVITVIEEPSVPTRPNPRGRVRRAVVGLVLGGALAVLLILIREGLRRRQQAGDADVEQFVGTLRTLKPRLPIKASGRATKDS